MTASPAACLSPSTTEVPLMQPVIHSLTDRTFDDTVVDAESTEVILG